jgi:hypothetical protein
MNMREAEAAMAYFKVHGNHKESAWKAIHQAEI